MEPESIYYKYSQYGWRARIGLLAPASNITLEPEFNLMAPEGVSIHASRLQIAKSYSSDSTIIDMSSIQQAAQLLTMIDSSVIVFGCTSSSFMENEEKIIQKIEDETGVPAITSSGAVLKALNILNVNKIGLVTPYLDIINEKEKEWLESKGFEVLNFFGLGLGKNESEIKRTGRQPAHIAYELAGSAAKSGPEAIFISCGNFATAPVIEPLEVDFGIPVVTSSQASFWYAVRMSGLKLSIEGFGTLLKKNL